MNRELILREYLATERTKLVNESTLLAYIRTGLYFLVAGSTLGQLVDTTFWKMMGTPLVVIGMLIMIAGFIRHHQDRKAIEVSKQNIGSSSDAFIKMARGL